MARRPATRARTRQNKVNRSLIANPMPWPNGARCAVAITFDIDTDSFLHLEHRDKAPDMLSALSWLRYDEVAAGRVDHAIRMTVPVSRNAYVWPARHKAGSTSSVDAPAMGQRFRLKASVKESDFPASVGTLTVLGELAPLITTPPFAMS